MNTQIVVFGVEYPGRGSASHESPITDMKVLSELIASEIVETVQDKPFIFFGHSIGAVTSYYVCMELQNVHGISPSLCVFSGHGAPHCDYENDLLYNNEAEIRRMIMVWNENASATEKEHFTSEEWLFSYVPLLQADFKLCELNVGKHMTEFRSKLASHVVACSANDDEYSKSKVMVEWAKLVDENFGFEHLCFEGGHFHFRDKEENANFICDVVNDFAKKLSVETNEELWNQKSYPDECLHITFMKTAKLNPGKICIVDGLNRYTYSEFERMSTILAKYLRSIGVGTDIPVVILMKRSFWYILAYTAILRANGAYIPIETAAPAALVQDILKEVGRPIVLTEPTQSSKIGHQSRLYIELERIWDDISKTATSELESVRIDTPCSLDDVAFIAYTSGSTGRPKGVVQPHRSPACSYHWRNRNYPYSSDDRIACNIFFVWEAFRPLMFGAPLYIIPDDVIFDPFRLLDYLEVNRITRILFTPTLLEMLLDTVDEDQLSTKLKNMRIVWLCGEVVTVRLMNRFMSLFPNTRLLNLYSISEAHDVASLDLTGWVPPEHQEYACCGPIMDNVQVCILNGENKDVGKGEVGEVYCSGHTIAYGYYGRDSITKDRFLRDISSNDDEPRMKTLYRTGDLGRFVQGGILEIVGRCDTMVKLRGYSVDLGALENRVIKYPSIEYVRALVKGEGLKRGITCVIVCKDRSEKISKEDLGLFISDELPEYYIPSSLEFLDKIPISDSSGKLDVQYLVGNKIPGSPDKELPALLPELNETEAIVAGIFSDLLNVSVEEISKDSDFYALGGHSLLIVKLMLELKKKFEKDMSIAEIIVNRTVSEISRYISGENIEKATPVMEVLKNDNLVHSERIAIVGCGCRLPHCKNHGEFWDRMLNRLDFSSEYSFEHLKKYGVPDELINDSSFVKRGYILDDIDKFDSQFFSMTELEAKIMDPQIRLFMEVAHEALECASINPKTYALKSKPIGVYAGNGWNYYIHNHLDGDSIFAEADYDPLSFLNHEIGNADYIATRTAYHLGLTGPAINIQSSCSTGLSAITTACAALRVRDCYSAIAGASNVQFSLHPVGYLYIDGMVQSDDGYCRTFDAKANGTTLGDGVVALILKRLDDAVRDRDTIIAVIDGYGMNNDGNSKPNFCSTSVESQANAIRRGLSNSNASVDDIDYVETHGTATKLGDFTEISSLKSIFTSASRSSGRSYLLGSVKTILGHSNIASGAVSVLRTALSLYHRYLIGNYHFNCLNPSLELSSTPFKICCENQPFPDKKAGTRHRVLVTGLGVGGTNVSTVLSEWEGEDDGVKDIIPPLSLCCISHDSEEGLSELRSSLSKCLLNEMKVNDMCYSLMKGRIQRRYKWCSVLPSDPEEASALLLPGNPLSDTSNSMLIKVETIPRKIVFVFPGQGTLKPFFALALWREVPIFARYLDAAQQYFLMNHSINLKLLLEREDRLTTLESHIVIGSVEYSLAKCFINWGIIPDVLIGHSLGEIVALGVSEMLDFEMFLEFLFVRGRAVMDSEIDCDDKQMVYMEGVTDNLIDVLKSEYSLEISVRNDENSYTFNGFRDSISLAIKSLHLENTSKILNVRGIYHSSIMENAVNLMRKQFADFKLKEPIYRIISAFVGDNANNNHDYFTSTDFWAGHIGRMCDFHSVLSTIESTLVNPLCLLLGNGLSFLKKKLGPDKLVSTMPYKFRNSIEDIQFPLLSVGKLWCLGVEIKILSLFEDTWRGNEIESSRIVACRNVQLPTYQFKKTSCYYPYRKFGSRIQKSVTSLSDVVYCKKKLAHGLIDKEKQNYNGTSHRMIYFGHFRNQHDECYDPSDLSADSHSELVNSIIEDFMIGEISELVLIINGLSGESYEWLFYALINCVSRLDNQCANVQKRIKGDRIRICIVLCGHDIPLEVQLLKSLCMVIPQEIPWISSDIIRVSAEEEIESSCDLFLMRNLKRFPIVKNSVISYEGFVLCQISSVYGEIARKTYADGVFVIFGGLGKIGRMISKHIAEYGSTRTKLYIISGRERASEEERVHLDDINRNISVVRLYSARSNSERDMKSLFCRIPERNLITAIFQCAGVANLKFVRETTSMVLQSEINAKISIIKQLELLSSQGIIDFKYGICFSSLASVLGGYAMAAYAGANAMMEQYLNGKQNWLTVAWDDWQFSYTKEQISHYECSDRAKSAILPSDGIELIDRFLGEFIHEGRVNPMYIVSMNNLQERYKSWIEDIEDKFSSSGENNSQLDEKSKKDASNFSLLDRLSLIFQQILEVESKYLDGNASFFELGGNSFSIARLLQDVRKEFNSNISIKDIIENQTMNGIIEIINKEKRTG